jgi:hypothetical protein
MPYLVETFHRSNTEDERSRLRADHLAFLDAYVETLLAAGAKLNDDGSVAPGSFYILAFEDRAAAEAFMASEPYVRAGICERIAFTRWRMGYFDHKRHRPSAPGT